MNERNNVYCPEYESFFHRAFNDFSQFTSFIAFMFWNIYSIYQQLNWIIIILIDIILSVNLIGLPIKYINYIGSLIINEKQGTIKIVLYRFDKIIKEFEIQIEDADVKVIEHWFYSRPIAELRVYSNGKYICKQRETKNWKVESFKEIKKITLELQQNIHPKK
jgi:hypothetical protein